jgi:hypothetical protein
VYKVYCSTSSLFLQREGTKLKSWRPSGSRLVCVCVCLLLTADLDVPNGGVGGSQKERYLRPSVLTLKTSNQSIGILQNAFPSRGWIWNVSCNIIRATRVQAGR